MAGNQEARKCHEPMTSIRSGDVGGEHASGRRATTSVEVRVVKYPSCGSEWRQERRRRNIKLPPVTSRIPGSLWYTNESLPVTHR